MQTRKRDTDVQNRLLDSVGEGEGWDVSREQHRNMYIFQGETDHWEDLEGSSGGVGGRGDWDGEHM